METINSLEKALELHKPFLDNAETGKYLSLVKTNFDGRGEKHHILPRSIFPQYTRCKWNIVNLSYEQHYEAHKLLPHCVVSQFVRKMNRAWWFINRYTKSNPPNAAEEYSKARELYIDSMRGCGNPMFGKTHTDEVKLSMRLRFTGRKLSEEFKTKMREVTKGSRNGMYGKEQSEYSRRLMSQAKASYEYQGSVYTLSNLAKLFNIGRACLSHRLDSGMQLKDALVFPVRSGGVLRNRLLDAGFVFNNGVWYSKEDASGMENTAVRYVYDLPRGEKNPNSVITDEIAFLIKLDLRDKISQNAIAAKYGVSKGCIKHISRGRTWKHVLVDDLDNSPKQC